MNKINLRNSIKKKRGRPQTKYILTPKGFIYVHLLPNDSKNVYDALAEWAKTQVPKGQIPALVFDNKGGTIIGVKKTKD